ncbi:MAG TPA: hypothetical protein ENN23_10305 [Deltaproteobacteria bacterium]|nr:hypothetical protein [Deltaproteobacteria bacterium]
MRKWIIIPIIFLLIGCSDRPSADLIRQDFQLTYPTAELILIKPLEKSSDTFRVRVSYYPDVTDHTRESGNFKEDVFLYKKSGDKWVMTWRRSSGK